MHTSDTMSLAHPLKVEFLACEYQRNANYKKRQNPGSTTTWPRRTLIVSYSDYCPN